MEDDTHGGGEVESGDDALEHPSSKLNWMQKIIDSACMGGISGPLVRVGYHQNVDLYHHAYCQPANTN